MPLKYVAALPNTSLPALLEWLMKLDFKFLPASTSDNMPFPVLNRVRATALTADIPRIFIMGRAVLIKLPKRLCPRCRRVLPQIESVHSNWHIHL